MKQHNPNGESRRCWGRVRERARMQARFNIRHRVATGETLTDKADAPMHAVEIVQPFLWRIVEGDRAFFSLPCLEANLQLLSVPLSTECLWEQSDDRVLIGEQKLLSWFGKDGVEELKAYIDSLDTFTFMEYVVWLRRYHILGSLLLGGVNPCIRGVLRQDTIEDTGDTVPTLRAELQHTGTRVIRRFFDSVPLALTSYIVKRVVDMRRVAWEASDGQDTCNICRRSVPTSLHLSFGRPCHHMCCEGCLWDDVVGSLDEREGDVVRCPVCATSPAVSPSQCPEDELLETESLPLQRRQTSLDRYMALPQNAAELKRSTRKKKRTHEWDILSSSWNEAVRPSLGLTRDVRRDKFFGYVEKAATHYVKGCLDAGIDVDLQNEYGQTALYIAAWRGFPVLVRLLLGNGSDLNRNTNGSLTVLAAAEASGCSDVICLIRPLAGSASGDSSLQAASTRDANVPSSLAFTTLIDRETDHPGAGSYMIDNAVSESMVIFLLELLSNLPVEENPKKKGIPCSVRSYFCDAEKYLSATLLQCLESTGQWKPGDVSVLPHMRFLNYSEHGAILSPHVDLSRMDASSGKRSTHSFLLYLTDCEKGGATTLLASLTGAKALARVAPRRGRLLVFPHYCPHEGEEVVAVPKILVRGEIRLPLLPNKTR